MDSLPNRMSFTEQWAIASSLVHYIIGLWLLFAIVFAIAPGPLPAIEHQPLGQTAEQTC